MAKRRDPSPGERLAAWRRIRRRTLQSLSDATGISVTALWRMENDQQHLRFEHVEALSRALGISVAEFAGEPSEEEAAG